MMEREPMRFPRCGTGLHYQGTTKFHEGARWGVFGEIGEPFDDREHFGVHVCPRCGRVAPFVDRIGDEFRPHQRRRVIRGRASTPHDHRSRR